MITQFRHLAQLFSPVVKPYMTKPILTGFGLGVLLLLPLAAWGSYIALNAGKSSTTFGVAYACSLLVWGFLAAVVISVSPDRDSWRMVYRLQFGVLAVAILCAFGATPV